MGYRAGDAIFREGDAPCCMYAILDGMIEGRRGSRRTGVVGPGQALGMVSLPDGALRTVTAEATTDCEVAAIDRRQFRGLVEQTPNLGWYVTGEPAHRLRATNAAPQGARDATWSNTRPGGSTRSDLSFRTTQRLKQLVSGGWNAARPIRPQPARS